MSKFKLTKVLAFAVVFSLLFAPLVTAQGPLSPASAAAQAQTQGPVSPTSDSEISAPQTSHRLIVELASPPAAVWSKNARSARTADDRLNLRAPSAQNYINQLQSEQAAFVSAMRAALPSASVSTYINENGQAVTADYQIVFNGMSIDPGANERESARRALLKLPGVKAVYPDSLYTTDLYTSTFLINAPTLWNSAAIGGRANAGKGVKVASMDGGVHKDAPMFSGAGFSYPPGYPAGGLGLTANNNGKIIASRAYFRSWDPPAPGDENPWPGENGTSHGVHTTGIAAGNIVDASYLGLEFPDMSGVAPAAWVMSYRVFYASANGNESFFTTEGIAALEDIVQDGADVLNNSWGEGPTSLGGEFDALDTALINAANAGIFISMSAGNAGPGNGTTDHPSDEYITVAASTTSGTLAAGVLNVTAPQPVPPALQGLAFGTAAFGAPLPLGTVLSYPFRAAANVNPANVEGCNPWPAGTFDGFAALIRRGACDFSTKVYNAEQAGAEFAVIYNHAAGGDAIINMSCVTLCDQIHISSVFIGHTPGEAMVTWHAANGDASTLEVSTLAFQAGNTPDVIADFSSRGPDTGNVFGPDIAAPGVNILSQGYTPGATGEARHLGYGQVSGTSMAAPHVAGAAALLRQIHPDWSNAYIKSALMSTAKYLEIYNDDGTPAQPLDMGAGRLDLLHAADPGVILDPPSLGFGVVASDETKSINVTVTSVASATETYTLGLLDTRAGFPGASGLPGFSVTPASITLAPGASATLTVTFDPAAGTPGENQGYVILDGTTHDAHLPAWARIVAATPPADVLVVDNDGSSSLGLPDYTSYYTATLGALGYTYNVLNADAAAGTVENFLPDPGTLFGYKAILYFTGDNFYPNGTFTVPTPLTQIDMDRLTEYANHGGILLAMGQDLASVVGSTDNDTFFYGPVLGATWLQDSVTSEITPTLPIIPLSTAPPGFNDLNIDVGASGDGAHNQLFIDEIQPHPPLVDVGDPNDPAELLPYTGLLRYTGPNRIEDGVVAVAHREQPTLERPGVSYLGRSIYTTFGLEGVNNNPGSTSRAELLQTFFNWAMDEPTVVISNTDQVETSKLAIFEVSLTSPISGTLGVSYRWDFGDGTPFTQAFPTQTASHTYEVCGPYTVRVEALDSYGNRTIGKLEVNITEGCTYRLLFPILFK